MNVFAVEVRGTKKKSMPPQVDRRSLWCEFTVKVRVGSMKYVFFRRLLLHRFLLLHDEYLIAGGDKVQNTTGDADVQSTSTTSETH